ncbi:MAG: YtxH domain-containing protein [Desulfobacterales bacterium]|nr:YtxH domain-containing protein [Desulfobacterales bacterium]
MDDRGYDTGSLVASFLLGGIVGAGIAILLAPQSGRETREKIKEFAETVKEKMASSVESAKDILEEKKSVLSAVVEAGKEAYNKEVNK